MTGPTDAEQHAQRLQEIISRPATPEEQATQIREWERGIDDALTLAYAYLHAGAQTWSPIDAVVGGHEGADARRARLWANVAEAQDREVAQADTAARLDVPQAGPVGGSDLSVEAALAELGDDPLALQLAATRRAAQEQTIGEQTEPGPTALERIQLARERVVAAAWELDHAEADLSEERPLSVDARLASVRALLADGDRILRSSPTPTPTALHGARADLRQDVQLEARRGQHIRHDNANEPRHRL